MSGETAAARDGRGNIGLLTLFAAFVKIGALGFGGVAPLARHVLVVERGFLEERGFAELFGFASTLPGANTVNLATIFGDRAGGLRGAAVALAGLLGAPLCILVTFAALYHRYGGGTEVRVALAGAAAAAAGLVGGTALRLLLSLGREPSVVVPAIAVGLAATAGAPLLLILAVAVPLSLVWQVARTRRLAADAVGRGRDPR